MLYIFLADGFEETEAVAPVDVIRRAGLEVKFVGVDGELVCGAHNITIKQIVLSRIIQIFQV